jgi:DNA-binding XRE family transcriptional regulator
MESLNEEYTAWLRRRGIGRGIRARRAWTEVLLDMQHAKGRTPAHHAIQRSKKQGGGIMNMNEEIATIQDYYSMTDAGIFDSTNPKARESVVKGLIAYRKEQRLTMVQMARALDIPYWTYVKYENKKRKPSRFTSEYLFRRLFKLRYDALHSGLSL